MDGPKSAWRVGIGGLIGRGVEAICQVCAEVAAVLPDISLHAWGLSLRALRSPLALPLLNVNNKGSTRRGIPRPVNPLMPV